MLSCQGEEDFITNYLADEVEKGYLLGPFDTVPFPIYRTNPIGIVEHKYSGKKRLILDLSAPHDSEYIHSLNSLIDKAEYSLSYVKVDDAIAQIQEYGRHSNLCKFDIRDAYKTIPINPALWCYHGVKWQQRYYFYKRLCFGSRSSPAIFSRLSAAIAWIAKVKYGVPFFLYLLDDFLTIIKPGGDADRIMALITHIFGILSVPLNPSKCCGPVKCLIYLGIEIDSLNMAARLPFDKLTRLRDLIEEFLNRKSCTKLQLLSLLGHLSYATKVIPIGRSFVARIIEASKSVKRLHHHINLSKECKADIKMWEVLAKSWNGIQLFKECEIDTDKMNLFTDASGLGYGAFYQGEYVCGPWDDSVPFLNSADMSIAFREFFPIVLASLIWGTMWERKTIVFLCDNMSVCDIVTKRSSKCPHIMKLMRRLVITATHCNFTFSAKHVMGKYNRLADALSRFDFASFQALAPGAIRRTCPAMPQLWFT